MDKNLLIIDDDIDITLMVQEYLQKQGYNILIANSGEEGITMFKENKIDLIMLDVMMPGIDGYATLDIIRCKSNVPVIMITAKGYQIDKVIGFKSGCDDYIVKPFDLVELSLRIAAILRRGNIKEKERKAVIYYKDLTINKDEYTVFKGDIELKLTRKEFEILYLLMSNLGRIYTSEIIYNKVWNEEYIENDNCVITHIRNLREKLGDKVKDSMYIKTIWGVGYKVEKNN